MLDTADVYCAETGEHLGQTHMSNYEVLRMTDVVLTIAHLDHVPEHCDPENLRALERLRRGLARIRMEVE